MKTKILCFCLAAFLFLGFGFAPSGLRFRGTRRAQGKVTRMHVPKNYTPDDLLAALTVWKEARGESPLAKRAVACVIRNRVRDRRWANRAALVVLQPLQFSCWNTDDPNATQWPGADAIWNDCLRAVSQAATLPDVTRGANHYHSYPEGHPSWPKWAAGEPTAKIGAFRFYKL